MWYQFLYQMLCMAYAKMLRELVKKAINDPNSDIDEFALGVLDRLFDYKG